MYVHPITLARPSSPLEDALLVERVQRDDESAFRAIYARHSHYIAGVVYRLMGPRQECRQVRHDQGLDLALDLRKTVYGR